MSGLQGLPGRTLLLFFEWAYGGGLLPCHVGVRASPQPTRQVTVVGADPLGRDAEGGKTIAAQGIRSYNEIPCQLTVGLFITCSYQT